MSSNELFITDVALRDGLQMLPTFVSTADKLRLLSALVNVGVRSAEVTSFVSAKAVPQMADAAEILASAQHLVERASCLVPNRRWLAKAIEAGAREIAVVVGATDTLNRRNIRLSLNEAIEEGCATLREARAAGLATRAYVAVAMACPYEGAVAPAHAAGIAVQLHAAGAQEVVLADTIGAGGPSQVRALLRAVLQDLSVHAVSAHFHDTRGLGVANVLAALDAGVRRFDASVGGLGGCPFAPGAAGNLATEDLVVLAHQEGLHTGIDAHALAQAVQVAAQITGLPLGGRSFKWLQRPTAHPSHSTQQETEK